jgi:hypothetical protein
MSLIAVLMSVFKARAKHTTATAAAMTELSDISHDLRQRVNRLEQENQNHIQVIAGLRQQLAQIPVLEAQVRLLSEELARVRLRHSTERDDLLTMIEQKDRELSHLRNLVESAGLTV